MLKFCYQDTFHVWLNFHTCHNPVQGRGGRKMKDWSLLWRVGHPTATRFFFNCEFSSSFKTLQLTNLEATLWNYTSTSCFVKIFFHYGRKLCAPKGPPVPIWFSAYFVLRPVHRAKRPSSKAGAGTYLLSRAAWVVENRWQAAKIN